MAEGIGQSALRKRLPQGVLQLWVDVDDSVPDATEVPFFDDFESWVSTALAAALTQTVDGPLSLVGEAHGLDTTGSMLDEAADAEPVIQFEISVRIVSASEMQALNRQYRQRDRPTNVLSFPSGLPLLSGTTDLLSLGDLVFCPQVVAAEAVVQEKSVAEHWAHLSVHGVLHLAGHDHEDEASAETMESLEIRILSELAIANPYLQPSAEQPPR